MRRLLSLLFFLPAVFAQLKTAGQHCTIPGQTPETAMMVCGSESFYIRTPAYCGTTAVPVPCPGGFVYTNKNPFFFRMNCFSSGTLGFLITPENPTSDFSWQLFDVTSTNPDDIFTNPSLFVACNWSSEPGETGASADGLSLTVCGGGGEPLYSSMPQLTAGRTYILMVTNMNDAYDGYHLLITGGTASITDQLEPALLQATAGCDAMSVLVRANKRLLCSSVAADGSDFTVSTGAAVISATGTECRTLPGSEYILVRLATPLPTGTHSITLQSGSDGNTLFDICSRDIPAGETVSFTVTAPQPIAMNNLLIGPGCSPAYIELPFSKLIRCNSIAWDASDIEISGPQPVTVSLVAGACSTDSLSSRIRLNFTTPLLAGGTYTVRLVTGSDGNSLLDECGLPVNGDVPLTFDVTAPLSSAFTVINPPSCRRDSVYFRHDGNNGTQNWHWDFGDGTRSRLQNPVHFYSTAGNRTVRLVVTNDHCTDSSAQAVVAGENLKAGFDIPVYLCAGDTLQTENTSTGNINYWRWNMGDGTQYNMNAPPGHRYPPTGTDMYFTVTLTAGNDTLGCSETVKKTLRLLTHCNIAVPTAFTPNADGKNDYLYPLNAVKADNLQFVVFNRYGQKVFETRDWTRRWDGTLNGTAQPTGVYAWMLSYTHHDTGEKVMLKGTSLLMR